MPRHQKLSTLLRDIAQLVDEEASVNPEFAARLDAFLTATVGGAQQSAKSRARVPLHSVVVPDVLTALESKGEDEFRFWIRSFDLATLKAVVKANGFDVAKTSQKWNDPDKFINLIVEQASARLRRGSGFLPPPASSSQ